MNSYEEADFWPNATTQQFLLLCLVCVQFSFVIFAKTLAMMSTRLTRIFFLMLITLFSCQKKNADPVAPKIEVSSNTMEADDKQASIEGYKLYTLRMGENYSRPNPFRLTTKSTLRFNAIFDSSCIYQTVDSVNQLDINKLYGFSDCNSQHLINSARVGWRWFNNELQLFAFVHNNGTILVPETLMGTAAIGSVISCRITCKRNVYEFEVNGVVKTLPRHCNGSFYTRYILNPYFGGNEPAPRTIRILLDEL
jgi:hypothetical protein